MQELEILSVTFYLVSKLDFRNTFYASSTFYLSYGVNYLTNLCFFLVCSDIDIFRMQINSSELILL